MARIANKLHRQVVRHLGSEGAAEKMTALAALFEEKPEIFSEYLPVAAGFAAFLDSIAESYKQYEDKNKMAMRNLQLSSEELNKVNRKLEFLNSSMNAMLESLGPGLLFFDKNGLCAPVFSKSCEDYLEHVPGGRYIWEVLGLNPSETTNFKSLMGFIANNLSAMSFDDLMALAPRTKVRSDDQILHIEYRPMRGLNKEITSVLVIITDKTQEEQAKKLIEEKDKAASSILRLAKNRNGFQQFIKNLRLYFLNGEQSEYLSEASAEDIRRAVHTFKGLAGVFFAESLSSTLHQLEDGLSGENLEQAQDTITAFTKKIEKASKETISYAEGLFGRDFIAHGETKTINLEKLRMFNEILLNGKAGSDVAERFYNEFLTVSIHGELEPLDHYIQELSQRMGKKISLSRFEGENFLISDGPYNQFFDSLVHIIRNIVDHGIEPVEIRQMLNKPDAGKVVFKTEKITRAQQWFRLTIEDDGAGINIDSVRDRLEKRGVNIQSMKDEEILQQIFTAGFSLRENVSNVSGRGIGLNAVHEEVKKLDGSIVAESTPGAGTRFIVELPFI